MKPLSTPKGRARKKLLEDCLILCVALILTEPHTTPAQHKLIPGLINRLRKELQ